MNWFLQQTRRDQLALIIGGFALGLAALWLIALEPLQNAAASAENRYQNTVKALARVTEMATQVRTQQQQAQQSNRSGQSVTQVIYSTTRAAGITQTSLQPGANDREARLRFEEVQLEGLIDWLYDLEANQQIQVANLQINASRQPGSVMAVVRLRTAN